MCLSPGWFTSACGGFICCLEFGSHSWQHGAWKRIQDFAYEVQVPPLESQPHIQGLNSFLSLLFLGSGSHLTVLWSYFWHCIGNCSWPHSGDHMHMKHALHVFSTCWTQSLEFRVYLLLLDQDRFCSVHALDHAWAWLSWVGAPGCLLQALLQREEQGNKTLCSLELCWNSNFRRDLGSHLLSTDCCQTPQEKHMKFLRILKIKVHH